MNRPGRRNDRSVEQSGVSRKNRSGNLGNRPGFLCEKLCFILYVARSWHAWPWSAWPEDTNARQRKLNRLPTGYRWHERIPGGSELHEAWGLHKFMLQSEIFSHFINVGVCDVACVRCFVHMHESWEGLRLFKELNDDHVKGYRCRKKEDKTNKSIEGKLFGYIFTVLTLKFALDRSLESVKKSGWWGGKWILSWIVFRFLFWQKK